MKMIECYDCKSKVPEIVLVDIDGKPICPECAKIRYKKFVGDSGMKVGLLRRKWCVVIPTDDKEMAESISEVIHSSLGYFSKAKKMFYKY